MFVALLALFVALSGTAVAAGIVPLAKRALVADNAKKLGGTTLTQLAAGIGVAIPLLVSEQTQAWSLAASAGSDFTTSCPTGAKAVAGGYDNPSGDAIAFDTRPSSDGKSWMIFLQNTSSSAGASGTLYAVCLA